MEQFIKCTAMFPVASLLLASLGLLSFGCVSLILLSMSRLYGPGLYRYYMRDQYIALLCHYLLLQSVSDALRWQWSRSRHRSIPTLDGQKKKPGRPFMLQRLAECMKNIFRQSERTNLSCRRRLPISKTHLPCDTGPLLPARGPGS